MSSEKSYNILEIKSAFYLNWRLGYFCEPKQRHQRNEKLFDSFSF
jgi:hypothetical protein